MNNEFTNDEFRFFLTTVMGREDTQQVEELHENSITTLKDLYTGSQQNMELVKSFVIDDFSDKKVRAFRMILAAVESIELTPFESKAYMKMIQHLQQRESF